MFIPRIHGAPPKQHSPASGPRRRLQYVIGLERLEIRTPLSAGFATSLGAHTINLAAADLLSQGATTIVDGPPVWLGSAGPAS